MQKLLRKADLDSVANEKVGPTWKQIVLMRKDLQNNKRPVLLAGTLLGIPIEFLPNAHRKK